MLHTLCRPEKELPQGGADPGKGAIAPATAHPTQLGPCPPEEPRVVGLDGHLPETAATTGPWHGRDLRRRRVWVRGAGDLLDQDTEPCPDSRALGTPTSPTEPGGAAGHTQEQVPHPPRGTSIPGTAPRQLQESLGTQGPEPQPGVGAGPVTCPHHHPHIPHTRWPLWTQNLVIQHVLVTHHSPTLPEKPFLLVESRSRGRSRPGDTCSHSLPDRPLARSITHSLTRSLPSKVGPGGALCPAPAQAKSRGPSFHPTGTSTTQSPPAPSSPPGAPHE